MKTLTTVLFIVNILFIILEVILIIFFIIIVVSTVLVYRSIRKFKLKNNPIKFKASLFGITDDYGSKFYIVLSYKNPDLFEPSGTTVLKPLF